MHGGRSSLLQGMLATRRRHAWTWLSQARARDVNVFVVGCPHQIMVITVLLFIPSGPEVPSLSQASADYCAEAPRLAEPPGLPLSSIKESPVARWEPQLILLASAAWPGTCVCTESAHNGRSVHFAAPAVVVTTRGRVKASAWHLAAETRSSPCRVRRSQNHRLD